MSTKETYHNIRRARHESWTSATDSIDSTATVSERVHEIDLVGSHGGEPLFGLGRKDDNWLEVPKLGRLLSIQILWNDNEDTIA